MFGVRVLGVCFFIFFFTLVSAEDDEWISQYKVPKCCAINENINDEGECVTLEEPLSFQPYFTDTPESYTNITENQLQVGNPCSFGR